MKDLGITANHVHLSWPTLLTTARKAKQATTGLVLPMTNNATTRTLSAQSLVLGGIMTASSPPTIASPGKPDLFETSGNSGSYSYSYPINVVPGPAGFMPQLALSYSSQITNGRYSQVSPAGDEGDGWAISLGSITAAQYPDGSAGGANTWYSINGVDGISDELIPTGTANQYATAHASHLLIVNNGSYWSVWGKDGTYYEFGNTGDSLQTNANGTYEWSLNKMSAPTNSEGQIKTLFVRYYQDIGEDGSTVRDSGISYLQYGLSNTQYATSLSQIMGTVNFYYHGPNDSQDMDGQGNKFVTAYSNESNYCPDAPDYTAVRCDDPIDYNGVSAPATMSTLTLDSIVSYVGDDHSNVPAYKYAFSYQDTAFSDTYKDPYTLTTEAAAGEHLLTQITPTVYVTGTAHTRQPVDFAYSGQLTDSYRDPNQYTADGSANFTGQTDWQYLKWYQDQETGTGASISYDTAYANMDGTPYLADGQGNLIDDRYDPLYCTYNANNSDPSKQCSGVYGNPQDYSWSLQIVTQIAALGTDSTGNPTRATTQYGYSLQDVPDAPPQGSCNPVTGPGIPPQEAYCMADSWVPGYSGGNQSMDGDWADYYHAQFRGFNVIYTTSAANNLSVSAYFSTAGWFTDEANGANYNGGQQYEEKVYQGPNEADSALLTQTLNYYTGVGDTPTGNAYSGINTCNNDFPVIYMPCVPAALESKVIDAEGHPTNAPWTDTKYTYDDISLTNGYVGGYYHNLLQEVTTGSNLPTSVYPLTQKWTYAIDNATAPDGVFRYNVDHVAHSETDDASGHVWGCQDTTYDQGIGSGADTPAAGWPTTTTAYSTCGNSATALKTYTAYDQYGNTVATVDPLGAANPSLYSSHGCVASGIAYVSSSWTAGHYTSCSAYNTGTQNGLNADLPVSTTNALGQTASMAYTYSSTQPLSSTVDLNTQTSSDSFAYDSHGNETITIKVPGETGSYTSQQSEASSCTGNSTLPCYQLDTNTLLYSSAITRTFYDQEGRAVETRTPGPTAGDDTIAMTVYNDQNNSVWKSIPFEVATGTGWLNPTGARDINGHAPAGTTTFADALGRTIATQDPNLGSGQEPGLTCSTTLTGHYTSCANYSWGTASGTGDTSNYASVTGVDPNGHVSISYSNVVDQSIYGEVESGISGGTLTLQKLTTTHYNALGKPTSVVVTDKAPQTGQSVTTVTTTMTYDDLGRMLTTVDPDQGTFTASYDADGHMLSVVQTSGSSSRTIGYNYDLLGRVGCEQTATPIINATGACSAGSPLVVNTYDTTKLGTQGTTDFPIGHLTQSVATTYYPNSVSATVTQQYQTDKRGRTVATGMQVGLPSSWNVTTSLPTYQLAATYNDADQVTTTTATAGTATYSFSPVYSATNGSLQGLSSGTNGSTANLASLAYNEYTQLSSITLLNGSSTQIASAQYSYDGDQRPTSLTTNWLPGSGKSGEILGQNRTYDNASNVTSTNAFFAAVPGQSGSGGSEVQNFCYDSLNRLTWSGNGGTQPGAGSGTCGSGTLASGLTGAGYTAPYTYTNLGQIWQGPLNGHGSTEQYVYCNSAPHQLSGIYPTGTTCANKGSATAVYSASYDPWGNETGRTYNSVTSTLSYDTLNRLTEYNAGSSSQEFYLYDAGGNRVLKRSISGSTTTLTAYAYGLQELTYTGAGAFTSQTDYYSVAGHLIGSTNGTTTTYDLTDAQGSVLTTLSTSAVLGEQVYGPYGNQRYVQGTLGTDKGYTGQFHDAVSGLDYYNARYYDPVMAQFLSADVKQGNAQGMDPYSYVAGNPETATDPTGQRIACPPDCGTDGGGTPCTLGDKGCGSPAPSPTPSPTPRPAPSPTPSPTPRPTPRPAPRPAPSPTPRPAPSPAPSPAPTSTPTLATDMPQAPAIWLPGIGKFEIAGDIFFTPMPPFVVLIADIRFPPEVAKRVLEEGKVGFISLITLAINSVHNATPFIPFILPVINRAWDSMTTSWKTAIDAGETVSLWVSSYPPEVVPHVGKWPV